MAKAPFILLLLGFIFYAGCSTKPISVYPVNEKSIQTIADTLGEKEAGGFFFSLPRTVIDVDTTIEVKSQTTGKYYKALALYDAFQEVKGIYAGIDEEIYRNCNIIDDKFIKKMSTVVDEVKKIVTPKTFSRFQNDNEFRNTFRSYFETFIQQIHEDYVKENKTQYQIKTGSVAVSSEPDPQKLFFAMIPKGKLESKGIKLTLTEQGTPTSVSASSTNNTLDYTFAAAKSVAAIAGAAIKSSCAPSLIEQLGKDYLLFMRNGLKIMAYAKDMETDIGAMKRDAETYWHLNSQLQTLLKSRNIQTAEAYEGIIKPIQERMAEIKQRFTGSSKTATKTAKARIIPDSPRDLGDLNYKKDYTLFTFNEDGLFFSEDYMTAKVCKSSISAIEGYKEFKIRLSTNTKPFNTSTTDSIKTIQSLYAKASGNYPYGIPFNVPGLVKVEAIVDGKGQSVLKTEVCRLSQFGTMGHMPHKIDGKSCQYTLTYFEDTGAIKVMDINSTGFDSSSIEAVGEGLAAILSIETVRLQNEATKATAKKTIEDAK